ncbi:flagellar hook-basal body complex protein [Oceanobacter kriegii]|uniref:flagellar hook-basal body complex protein n=1 Tax=Oceanobacter kriegii TaxID=64972 RepID=UPI0004249631|nr:flagellar hook-basal body complex protein [Oceanobacter kriegii]
MAFNIGLSGINAASTDLSVTGNNIANASTTGFKESRAEFGDVYTNSLLGSGSAAVGSGVSVADVAQEFTQGSISATDNTLDLAIDGNGFFVLNDNGSQTYTRSGAYNLDADGYVTANNGAVLQGFLADENGEIAGVLQDLQIDVTSQSPQLTSDVQLEVNLDASEPILQELGTTVDTTGLAIGAVDAGIPESTFTTLSSAGQPMTAGTAARVGFATDLTTVAAAGYGAISMDIDVGDGSGAQTITLDGVAAGGSVADILSDVQGALDDAFGSQQFTASQGTGGELVITRAGYAATNGSAFTLSNTAAFDAAFGASGAVSAGTQGSLLFVGDTPLTIDLSNTPGTSTTTRTTATPPLNIVASDAGELAELTAGSIIGAQDLSTANGNVLAFTIATGNGSTYNINLSEASWASAAPADYANVTTAELVAEINTQIAAQSATPDVNVVNSSGFISFQAQAPATEGDYVQLADNTATSNGLNLTDLGFSTSNRYDGGEAPVDANNEFQIEVTSTTGNTAGPYTITIPPNTYADLDDLANAIQQQFDLVIGANGLADNVSVEAVGGQLVFTNLVTGSGEGIDITATGTEPQAVTELGFDSLYAVAGTDAIDRSNSFRINLTVPQPDEEGRSGSVLISLDQEISSVQELASAINAQLNSQDSDSYIGVQAYAVEVEPATTPIQYQLELRATDAGEASTISITNINASGSDITDAELFALLQVDASDDTLMVEGIEGVNNGYPETMVTLTNPEGEESIITIPEYSAANEIVALLNDEPGVTASATSTATLTAAGYNSPGNDMTITLNGQQLTSTSLEDLAEEINEYTDTSLPGFTAEINADGDLVINSATGRDIDIEISSSTDTDSLVIVGSSTTGPQVLGGSAGAASAATIGGTVNIVLNEGYNLSNPTPSVSGIFGTLNASEYTEYALNTFDPNDSGTYNHSTSVTIYDSQGNDHVMTQYFVREPATDESSDSQWVMYVTVDGQNVGDPDSTLDYPANQQATMASFDLYFNQDGTIDEDAVGEMYITNWDPLDSNGDRNGAIGSMNVLEGGLPLTTPANSSNFQISLEGTTLYGSDFAVNEVDQNGYTTGRLSGLQIDDDGIIFAQFTNGQSETLGQVALANFTNPEGLTKVGDTAWAESYSSGVPTIGEPNTASLGQIQSSALEDSNVDLSEELVQLIIAQRNFQANAKTIETSDQVTQAIINI